MSETALREALQELLRLATDGDDDSGEAGEWVRAWQAARAALASAPSQPSQDGELSGKSVLSHKQAADLVNAHGMNAYPVMQVHEFMAAIENAVRAAGRAARQSDAVDARRLDWLTSTSAVRVQGSDARGWMVVDYNDGCTILTRGHATARAAIDAAMQQG